VKQGSLFCFVYNPEMSQTTVHHATLDIFGELFNEWGAPTWFSLELQQKLLIAEPLPQ
jgi:hypothetical protein